MLDFILQLLIFLPPQLVVFIVAMTPIFELRGAIPLGIFYGLPLWQVWLFSVLGNIIPAILIIKCFPALSSWLRVKMRLFEKFFDWLFERTRNKFSHKYEKYGLVALILFVGIPLPITGAWTGALAAWLFGLDFKKSIIFIFLGLLLSALIVTISIKGGFAISRLIINF